MQLELFEDSHWPDFKEIARERKSKILEKQPRNFGKVEKGKDQGSKPRQLRLV